MLDGTKANPRRPSLGRWLAIALLATILATGGSITWFEVRSAERFMRNTMLYEARMVAESLNKQRVAGLTGTAADTESDDYHYLRNQLIRMRAANPNYRYLYMFGRRAGEQPFFFMGTAPEDSPDYSPPGQVYFEDSPTLNHVFAAHEAMVSPPFTDRWGTWISSLVPLFHPETGELMAVVGMDFDARDWQNQVLYRAIAPVAVTLLALILLGATGVLFRHRQTQREKEILAGVAAELERFFDVVPDLLCIANLQGRFLKINRAWTEVLGYSPGELKEVRFLDIVYEKDRQSTLNALSAFDEEHPVLDFANRCRSKDGGLRHIEWRAQRYGELVYAAARDITDRVGMETQLRQAQKMEAVGQLAGGVAHDFNNLLQAIMGYASIMEKDLTSGSAGHAELQEIMKASKRAADLTRQLLAFSRRQVLDTRPLSLNELVNDLMKMLNRIIGEDVEIKFIPGSEMGIVEADYGQIEQVVVNLCVNARDAMPEGGQLVIETDTVLLDDVYCKIHTWAKPGLYSVLTVSDSGHGIPPDILDHIFEPFFTTKDVGKGTGLGLATVYGIVKQHKGLIHVYSEPGGGTSFRVYLPSREGKAQARHLELDTPTKGKGETILVAEDEEQVRSFLKAVLEQAGYNVLVAVDGESAIQSHRNHKGQIDCLLLDVIMPRVGGRQAYEEIASERPGIRCLFASGYSLRAAMGEETFGDKTPLIQKPYHPDDLLRRLRTLLDA